MCIEIAMETDSSLTATDEITAKEMHQQDVWVKYLSIVVDAWDEAVEVKQVKGCAESMT